MKPLIAANLKMHALPAGWDSPSSPYRPREDVDVLACPTALSLRQCVAAGIATGAQFGRPEASGAFTGDISMAQIAQAGARYVLCGHSDRRRVHGETDELVAQMVVAAIEENLHPILCIGETAEEHEQGKSEDVVRRQLAAVTSLVKGMGWTIAYEPVWAISRGDAKKAACSPPDAQRMHAAIRSWLPTEQRGIRILYGGSMKAENAESLLTQPDIDGGLVGAASLDLQNFQLIVDAAARVWATKAAA